MGGLANVVWASGLGKFTIYRQFHHVGRKHFERLIDYVGRFRIVGLINHVGRQFVVRVLHYLEQ